MLVTTFQLFLAVVFSCGVNICAALEELAPERLLQPRNFNPHPYQARGPVLFPSNNNDVDVDEHPYAKVVQKQKLKLRLDHQDNQISPQVYGALARHAQKVLQNVIHPPNNPAGVAVVQPPPRLVNPTVAVPIYQVPNTVPLADPSYSNQKKDYAFSYVVQDQSNGDDFSHSQSQNSRATSGEYRVKLPDGRLQIVSYSADKDGYKADVKYSEEVAAAQNDKYTGKPTPVTVVGGGRIQESGDYVEYNTPYYVPSLHYNGIAGGASKLLAEEDDITAGVYQNQVGAGPQHFIAADKFSQLYPEQKVQLLPQFANIVGGGGGGGRGAAVEQKEQQPPRYSAAPGTKVALQFIASQDAHAPLHNNADLQRYSQVYFNTPNQQVHHEQHHGYY